MIEIKEAKIAQAKDIARLIMLAMNHECCLYFCGEGRGLDDFLQMMTHLVEQEDSQYSYRNTLVAMDGPTVAGALVMYDGGELYQRRKRFVEAAKVYLGTDFSGMADETEAGELYIDSLAVLPAYRRQGIATLLLNATPKRAVRMGIGRVGLLVDGGNPSAERLYRAVGFRHVGDNVWGGHFMRHLVKEVKK
ncbi:MAG: GNAT family N-acetyltransferase [Prevotellaceae bacterium]|nr:GNAT family N-acetyltransferase [Prevotella sp.]MDD7257752.1 GNAT family N-acetyltransferase [Prevotellaceae bacterium]MDY6130513.1 GNAT family N-acetyltransferase [Prevotella sp.]